MQREQNLLDLFCCNKPSLVKACISIPGISEHSIVLADCDLKVTINKKPPRKVYQWSKADWQLIKEQTVIFAKQFMALAQTRTVKENYTVFIEYMEGILLVNIPSKLSLTCITCKLFEHIICKHILAHLKDHNILTDLQHGFRSGRSCETQLVTTFPGTCSNAQQNRQSN